MELNSLIYINKQKILYGYAKLDCSKYCNSRLNFNPTRPNGLKLLKRKCKTNAR